MEMVNGRERLQVSDIQQGARDRGEYAIHEVKKGGMGCCACSEMALAICLREI